MQGAESLKPITLGEFEAMEKDDRFNYELIDGIVMMSPSPSREHQCINSNLHFFIRIQLERTDCKSLFEFDVTIDGSRLRPDMSVYCDNDAELPDIVFEILSPSTKYKDLTVKSHKYEAAGIKEYWIIDPKIKSIIVNYFFNQTAETYGLGETAVSLVRPEIQIELAKLFA